MHIHLEILAIAAKALRPRISPFKAYRTFHLRAGGLIMRFDVYRRPKHDKSGRVAMVYLENCRARML